MQEHHGPPQPVRAHARRNREKLLAAALEEFDRAGKDASLGGIAKAAGVGIATLYRHFPDRESLVLAAYRYEVDQLCSAADDLLEAMPPNQALREWMKRLASLMVTKQQMSAALQAMGPSGGGWASESYAQVFRTVGTLVDAGVAAGTVRGDLETADVVLAMSGLLRLDVSGDWRPQADRLIGLLMDGLQAGARSSDTAARDA
ncbi:TetR/AcrR family transcriptional regulator [Streptomyces sp. NBC_00243]|uniref:TetR/AcrR family transcriptional regulator n=1 Tax=Streptomyces sp. NBC_00243 TaxID=2975688 RepID=UPI002DD9F665|nr:TetR/AcrR family transcriptional regulator [Streptomyces sp. NBC_00243]WRZ25333.1 TetR/AcrR family transcriptional regulator [Streptomyces sp. NBC_00243]